MKFIIGLVVLLTGCSHYKLYSGSNQKSQRDLFVIEPNLLRVPTLGFPNLTLTKLDSSYQFTYNYSLNKGSSIRHKYHYADTLYEVSQRHDLITTNVDISQFGKGMYRGQLSEIYWDEDTPILRYYDIGAYRIVEIELEEF